MVFTHLDVSYILSEYFTKAIQKREKAATNTFVDNKLDRPQEIVFRLKTSRQSYKTSTSVNYDARVVVISNCLCNYSRVVDYNCRGFLRLITVHLLEFCSQYVSRVIVFYCRVFIILATRGFPLQNYRVITQLCYRALWLVKTSPLTWTIQSQCFISSWDCIKIGLIIIVFQAFVSACQWQKWHNKLDFHKCGFSNWSYIDATKCKSCSNTIQRIQQKLHFAKSHFLKQIK